MQGISIYGISWFVKRLKRSVAAIRAKARREFGPMGMTRGALSLADASRRTGYHRGQLKRAAAALAQHWKRTSARGPYLIYEEQLEELVDWLKSDYWCPKLHLYCCIWCATEARPHRRWGLCDRCSNRYAKRLIRAGLPISTKGLLELVTERNRDSDPLLSEAARQLENGRAIREPTLRALLNRGALC